MLKIKRYRDVELARCESRNVGRSILFKFSSICSSVLVFSLLASMLVVAGCARSKSYSVDRKNSVAFGQSKRKRGELMKAPSKLVVPKKRILVLSLWNDTPIKGDFTRNALSMQKRIIQETTHANVVSPPNQAFNSQDFYIDAERLNMPLILEKGRKWGLSLVLVGRITSIKIRTKEDDIGVLRPSKSRAAVTMKLKMIDIGTSKEIFETEIAGTSSTSAMNLLGSDVEDARMIRNELIGYAIETAFMNSMPGLRAEIDRIEWRGRIARIMGNRIYLNAGRSTGIGIGDILKVTGMGQDIYDPETGVFIGHSEGEIKGTVEVIEYFGGDGSIARVHSGGNFQEADIIRLY